MNNHVEIYKKCWGNKKYRRFSPGLAFVESFLEMVNPLPGQTLIDWGCGAGRAGLELSESGFDVTLIDFADNCLDSQVFDEVGKSIDFKLMDLTKPIDIGKPSDYGFCADVLEHIPEEDVDTVIDNILKNSNSAFFQISCVKDHYGSSEEVGGESTPLHICVHDYRWWMNKFVEKQCVISMSRNLINTCVFYVTKTV